MPLFSGDSLLGNQRRFPHYIYCMTLNKMRTKLRPNSLAPCNRQYIKVYELNRSIRLVRDPIHDEFRESAGASYVDQKLDKGERVFEIR